MPCYLKEDIQFRIVSARCLLHGLRNRLRYSTSQWDTWGFASILLLPYPRTDICPGNNRNQFNVKASSFESRQESQSRSHMWYICVLWGFFEFLLMLRQTLADMTPLEFRAWNAANDSCLRGGWLFCMILFASLIFICAFKLSGSGSGPLFLNGFSRFSAFWYLSCLSSYLFGI